MGPLITDMFEKVLAHWRHASTHEYVTIFELISLAVGDMDIAEDLMFHCLEQHSSRVLTERPAVTQRLVRSLLGITLEHIEEVANCKVKGAPLLSLKVEKRVDDGWVCESPLRIDAPSSIRPKLGDHIRLRPAGAPSNAPLHRPASIDALVMTSEQGLITFKSLQQPPPYAEACSWLLTHCAPFTTTKTAFDATDALFSAQGATCGIADYLNSRTVHIQIATNRVESSEQTDPTFDGLNRSQSEAVDAAIHNQLVCLWGPPGTGKTHTILTMLEKLIAADQQRILVTAPTNNAVDNILQRFAAKFPHLIEELGAVRVATDVSFTTS